MDELAYKYALLNAVKHAGKAQPGAVVGSALAERPELKGQMKELHKAALAAVGRANKMPAEEQLNELRKIAPELLEKQRKEKDIFAFLGIAENEEVTTAFPPGPEKYPHIGHAKALLLNQMLAKKYNGRFILRFEDTNPALVRQEYIDAMIKDFEWLGVTWDRLIYASDFMELFYSKAEEMIAKDRAYVCSCASEKIKASRAGGKACECRAKESKENLIQWQGLSSAAEGAGVLRLKIDLKHKNTTMRDPTVFRILDAEHVRHGRKFRLWPTYDFQNAVMDGETKVTHRLRSKEFELRNELQRWIQAELGYNQTSIYEFARFNMEGVESSGRAIRAKIAAGELCGWDDPALTTLAALRRRGFRPEAIKTFVLSTGITKAESTLTWDDLIVHNKRLLDSDCNRYFFVQEPQKIVIEGAPPVAAMHKLHPEHPERGVRRLESHGAFVVSKHDFQALSDGHLYRLMDCLNFTKQKARLVFHSLEYAEYKKSGEKIMHYLPDVPGLMQCSVLMPDGSTVTGLSEPMTQVLEPGAAIQFERFGFCRLDRRDSGLFFWFTHA